MPESIKKRDGRLVPYDEAKIASAIDRAFVAAESGKGADEALSVWRKSSPAR